MSWQPKYKGINQLPKPPIKIGIITKKIIIKAWEVTKTLYICSLCINIPGFLNSKRINKLILEPKKDLHNPNIKYIVPISLWLVEKNHRFNNKKNKFFIKIMNFKAYYSLSYS